VLLQTLSECVYEGRLGVEKGRKYLKERCLGDIWQFVCGGKCAFLGFRTPKNSVSLYRVNMAYSICSTKHGSGSIRTPSCFVCHNNPFRHIFPM
jgi:hypothetical protein